MVKASRPQARRIYFPNGQTGYRHGLQPRHSPPSPMAAISARVTETSAATYGSTRSKTVAPPYITQPGSPMTGVPSSK